jgi:hypothetical protein
MTMERLLRMNGDLKDPAKSDLMEVIRRFHALSRSHDLPYCVVGGMAVVRKRNILPLKGEVTSEGLGSCVDAKTGITIDILFADEDRGMVIDMPDPRIVGEFDEELGARFIGLHDLVQLKLAVYLVKFKEFGPATAARDLADVQGLMKNNLAKFSKSIVSGYHPAVRKQCLEAYDEVARAQTRKRPKRRDIER